ncbi:MAG: molybdopterin-binding protein [Candidatus Hodarchaeaceae archaeon]|nr:molybdopterin-binding protein [Candidatus Hodarchaeaceae archaeon]
MPTAEILTIGSELIEGLRVNTNATWLAKKLTSAGILVKSITSTGDITSEIVAAIQDALRRAPDVLIITGGLGPTPDDKTCEALARATGRKLVLDTAALELVKMSYVRLRTHLIDHKALPTIQKKMACIPEGATALPNPVGLAPGTKLKHGKTLAICLPGVPAEMRAIFTKYVYGDLLKLGGRAPHGETVNVEKIDEMTLAPFLEELAQKFPHVDIRSYPSGKGKKSRVRVVFVAPKAIDAQDAAMAFKASLKRLRHSLTS